MEPNNLINFELVEIVEIEEYEEEDVYDITNYEECWQDEGNFVANDILVHNCIPDYLKRRDDKQSRWKEREFPGIAEDLKDTYGICVYQEQVALLMQKYAGFTGPEAAAARKAFSKKWAHKLKDIEAQFKEGATEIIGEDHAVRWWDLLEKFARYSFNLSHSCAYIMIGYWCLWLKTHYAPEWWATVMSYCDNKKLNKYMNVAKSEGIKFGDINLEHLSVNFSVDPDTMVVTPGLTSIKKVGDKVATKLAGDRKYENIDDFISTHGKNKIAIERLIKLGAFTRYHPSRLATWKWYQFMYCVDKDSTQVRNEIREILTKTLWTPDKIEEERRRQIEVYKKERPRAKLIPKKILNWKPKVDESRESVMKIYENTDYSLKEILAFEKEFLGYYWHSPMDIYKYSGSNTIQSAKSTGMMEIVIDSVEFSLDKNNKQYAKLSVVDGVSRARVMVWSKCLESFKKHLVSGNGLKISVSYDDKYDCFTVRNGTVPITLMKNSK